MLLKGPYLPLSLEAGTAGVTVSSLCWLYKLREAEGMLILAQVNEK